MNKENCALKLVDEIILYYDARSKKHQITEIILIEDIPLCLNTKSEIKCLKLPSKHNR